MNFATENKYINSFSFAKPEKSKNLPLELSVSNRHNML